MWREHKIENQTVEVLISTYWNVNTMREAQEAIDKCFNLNLLECK